MRGVASWLSLTVADLYGARGHATLGYYWFAGVVESNPGTPQGFEIINSKVIRQVFSCQADSTYPWRYPSDECRFQNSAGCCPEVLEISEVA